jgi:flagellar assembly protein FliH
MSTSSSTALDPATPVMAQPFPYPEAFAENGSEAEGRPVPATRDGSRRQEAREVAARELGQREGMAQAQAHLAAELAREREAVANALRVFAEERETFYRKVEGEVVNLALSIARKILHREAQIDPLLLAGMVRVALEKIESGTQVMVRVHPQLASAWREYFARSLDPRNQPEMVEDPALETGRCVIQTLLGKTELGLDVQLKEIEQGLLDLLAQRPR